MNLKQLISALTLSAAFLCPSTFAQSTPPPLATYQKTSGVAGSLSSVGSDTLANMMTLWAEEFKHLYPNVTIQIQAAGSSTAPIALAEATSQFGPMSRKMKPNELEAFERNHGYQPTAIRVAIDALAVFVDKDNPLQGLTLPQIDGIFSSTHKCSEQDIRNWGQLGLTGNWQNRDIQLYGRNSVSGTYGYFKTQALCKGDFKSNVNEQPGSASVVQSVSRSRNAIGYSGIGYLTAGVKAVPIAKHGQHYIEATVENATNGSYPLSRYLYLYINKHPNKPLTPMAREFVRFILSKQGQEIVKKDGYVPVPSRIAARDLAQLGIASQ